MIISKDMQWKIRDCFDYLAKTITRLTWVYKTTVKNNTSLLVKHRHTFDFEIKPTDHMKVCGGSSYAEVPTDAIRMKPCLINPDRRFNHVSSHLSICHSHHRVQTQQPLHSVLHYTRCCTDWKGERAPIVRTLFSRPRAQRSSRLQLWRAALQRLDLSVSG